jgi:protein-disulfide isomerase
MPAVAARDNAAVSDVAAEPEQPEVVQRPMPRRGRPWVILILLLGAIALGYALVNIATQKPNQNTVHIAGVEQAQQLFGGVPQEGARLGSEDAPVTIQVFGDEQSSECREGFLATIPALTEKYARPGSVKFLYRHYSNSENEIEYGFYGTEAAAEQGYGWQYIYLFFRNQAEAGHFGVDQDFLDSIAGGVEELNGPEWEEDLEDNGGPDGVISKRLAGYEELGSDLGIRVRQAMIVSGPNGTETLQDGPSLGQVERAIEAVQ